MAKNLLDLEHKEFIREHYLKTTGIALWYPKFMFANSKQANKPYIDKSKLSFLPVCLALQPVTKTSTKNNSNNSNHITTKVATHENTAIPTDASIQWQTKKKLTVFTKTDITTSKPTAETITSQDNTVATSINKAPTNNLDITKYHTDKPQLVNLLVWKLNNNTLVIGDICNLPEHTNFFQIKTTLAKTFIDFNIETQTAEPPIQFIWPPSNKGIFKKLYNTFTATVEAFSAFLIYQLNFDSQKKIILFGSQAAKIIKAKGEDIKVARGMQQCKKTKKYYFVTHSLTNIINNPQIKSSVYNDISRITQY
jgi:hypothetical protein